MNADRAMTPSGPGPSLLRASQRAGLRIRGAVARAAASSSAAVTLVERVGLHTLADQLDHRRGGGDIAAIRVPPSRHAVRTRRIKAYRRGGRDLCIEGFYQAGWWGFERPLPDVVLATLRSAIGVFFDVGANTGVYSLIAATVPHMKTHAFEPYPPVNRLLRENLRLNRAERRIAVVDAAISDCSGEIELWVPPDIGMVESSSSITADFKEGSSPITVPTMTLDDYWAAIGSPAVAALKVDVEGAEHRVLAGADQVIGAARPVTFCEVLPRAVFDELEAFRRRHDLIDVRLGLALAVVGEPITFDGDAWNHALVPTERLDAFLSTLGALGLSVSTAGA